VFESVGFFGKVFFYEDKVCSAPTIIQKFEGDCGIAPIVEGEPSGRRS